MGLLEKIYDNSPVFIQNMMCSAKGWFIVRRRYNKDFHIFLNKYLKREVNQDELLMSFLLNVKHIKPYSSFISQGLDKDLSAKEIINSMPIIDKTFVKNHIEEFKNKFYHAKMIEMRTSGTTGSGLIFPYSVDMENKQWAIWWRYRIELGITLDTWCGWFGGRTIINPQDMQPPFWRINLPGKQIMFSSYHLTKDTVPLYHDEICKKGLKWLHGYPSSITQLASLIIENNIKPITCVNIVTTGAENLYDYQVAIMERAFPNAKVYQHYGLSEGVANFSQDKEGEWHIDDDFCYVEFIPLDKKNPNICRIIGTGFSNEAFPLIRYDTGDIANIEYIDGRIKIISIDGRKEDYVSLPNGIKLGRLDHIFKDCINIKEAQIYQKDIYNIIFKIVKGLNYTNKDEEFLINEIRKRIPIDVYIEIEYIDKLSRTKSGKLRLVISDV